MVDSQTDQIKENENVLVEDVSTNNLKIDEPNSNKDINEIYYVSNSYRWYMLVYALSVTTLVGPLFFNWPPLRYLILLDGGYLETCGPDDNDILILDDGIGVPCSKRATDINYLVGFAFSVLFIFTFVAGLLLDVLGSKICCLIGIISQVIGYVFFACSGPHFNGYKIGFFFCAAGSDASFFGLLPLANLFPTRVSTVTAAFGACRSISFFIPIVMHKSWNGSTITFTGISVFFGLLLFSAALSVYFIVPYNPYPKLPVGSFTNDPSNTSLLPKLHKLPDLSIRSVRDKAWAQLRDFPKYGFTWGYLCLIPLPAIALIRLSYYSIAVDRLLPHVEDLYVVLNPLTFLPTPILGYIADVFSPSLVIALCSSMAALSMFTVTYTSLVGEYISVLGNWIFVSFIASQFYVYIAYVYPQQHMGKLTGVVLMVGGILSNLASVLYRYAEDSESLTAANLIVVFMCLLSSCIVIGLYIFIERPVRAANKRRAATYVSNTELQESTYVK